MIVCSFSTEFLSVSTFHVMIVMPSGDKLFPPEMKKE